jgi:hypothetical protein
VQLEQEHAGVLSLLEEASEHMCYSSDIREWQLPEEALESKEAYVAAVRAALPLLLAVGPEEGAAAAVDASSSAKDATEHQSMRDIERDELVLNGHRYKGGQGSYAKVVAWLSAAATRQLEAVSAPADAVAPEVVEAFARRVLREVNRTNSGGTAYDVLNRCMGVEDVATVVPDSKGGE